MLSPKDISHTGFERANNALRMQIDISGKKISYLISTWEDGLDVYLQTSRGAVFTNVAPELKILGNKDLSHLDPVNEFLACIPARIKKLLEPFSWRQITMLRLTRLEPHVLDLLNSNPLLVWLLADMVNDEALPLDRAKDMVFWSREDILEHILGYASKSHLKLLNKVLPVNLDEQECRYLYGLLRNEEAKQKLRHCRRIVLPWVPFVLEHPDIAEMLVFRSEMENSNQSLFAIKHMKMLFNSCLQYAEQEGENRFWENVKRCRSYRELRQYHARLKQKCDSSLAKWRMELDREKEILANLDQRNRGVADNIRQQPAAQSTKSTQRDNVFPAPPVPGNEYIKPIQTFNGLRYEGSSKVMNNCVGSVSYQEKVLSGKSYIYRVYSPQRCTLEIGYDPDQGWRIVQLLLKGNCKPRQETKRYVQSWLKSGQDNKWK